MMRCGSKSSTLYRYFFFFNDTATTEIYTLSLHDALPISGYDTVVYWARSGLESSLLTPEGTLGQLAGGAGDHPRSEEHTSELQSRLHLVCRLLLEKKKTQLPHLTIVNPLQQRCRALSHTP